MPAGMNPTAPGGSIPIGTVGQIGIIVADIPTACARYRGLLGAGSWQRYTYGPATVPELGYRGRPGVFSMHIALGGDGPQIELIEPAAGPSIYHEHLRDLGPGVHHLGVFVDSLDEAIAAMAGSGYPLIQFGRGYGLDGDGGFAYFDTLAAFNTTIEAIEVPRRRRPPLPVWDRDPDHHGGPR